MAELTQPEKLGRHIIEQYLDGRDVMDSYTMSVDILARLGNAGLMIARIVPQEADNSLTKPDDMGFPDEGGVK